MSRFVFQFLIGAMKFIVSGNKKVLSLVSIPYRRNEIGTVTVTVSVSVTFQFLIGAMKSGLPGLQNVLPGRQVSIPYRRNEIC